MRVKRAIIVLLAAVAACGRTAPFEFGGRDAGSGGTGGMPSPPCVTTADCAVVDPCAPPLCLPVGAGDEDVELRCVPQPVSCDDFDECTADRCDPRSGACLHERPVDSDGDGFLAEAPASASCGVVDCDDLDPFVHPGAVETCDSRDNDCNGGVDDGFSITNVLTAPVPLLPVERGRAMRGGLVWNGQAYGVTYNTTSGHKQSFFKLVTPSGQDASAEVEVSQINADEFAGPVEWSGTSFLTAFADARQSGNYEVYAARFRDDGLKIAGGDLRLTDAPDFSLNPAVVWTGEEYVIAWDDRRGRVDGGFPQIYARRFSEFGAPLGDEVRISDSGEWGEFPVLALGENSVGIAYVSMDSAAVAHARFRMLDPSLSQRTASFELPGSAFANQPALAFAGGRFVVAWGFSFSMSVPGAAVHAAAIEESTLAGTGGHPVTFGFSFARAPALVSLGNRVFLAFSAAGPDGQYDIWATTLDPALATPAPASVALTSSGAYSLFPYAALGPNGTIGIVFDEDQETPPTSRGPYFMSVGCSPPLVP
jgi:hypothetical protein